MFNLARMSLLVWVAAKSGVAAIEKWHDPAGMTILAACFCGLWGLGEWLAKKQKVEDRSARVPRAESGVAPDSIKTQTDLGKQPDEHNSAPYPDPFPRRSGEAMRSSAPEPGNNGNFRVSKFQLSAFQISVFALAAWIVLTEAGVEAWYRSHELRHAPAPQWVVNWPTNNSAFKEMPLAEASLQILQCDANRSAGWRDNGLQWQTIFIKWNPGTLVQLGHRPSECMTAAGHTLAVIANSEWFDAAGFHLPFVVYEVTDLPRPLYIFYCMWNDRLSAEGFGKTFLNLYGNRLAPVLTGVRNAGQRSLEIAVDGAGSAEEARSAFRAELEKLVITAK